MFFVDPKASERLRSLDLSFHPNFPIGTYKLPPIFSTPQSLWITVHGWVMWLIIPTIQAGSYWHISSVFSDAGPLWSFSIGEQATVGTIIGTYLVLY